MDALREEDLRETLAAIRELAHSACHLADLAARMTRRCEDPELLDASRAATEASLRAAEGAFALEDALETDLDHAAVLWLSVETLASSQYAVQAAREAVESALALVMGQSASPRRHRA